MRDVRPGVSFASSYSKNTYSLLNFIATDVAAYTRFVESDEGNTVHFRMKEIEQWNREGESLFANLQPSYICHLDYHRGCLSSAGFDMSMETEANGPCLSTGTALLLLFPTAKPSTKCFGTKESPDSFQKGGLARHLPLFCYMFARPNLSLPIFSKWEA